VEAQKALSIMKLQAGGGEVRLFSATKRIGIEEVAMVLWDWAHPIQEVTSDTPQVPPEADL
jgi:GTP-binding protein